jgi:hypothetical protein
MIMNYLTHEDDRVEWTFGPHRFEFEVLKESGPTVRLSSPSHIGWSRIANFRTSEGRCMLCFTQGACGAGFRLYCDKVVYLTTAGESDPIGVLKDFENIKALLVRCGIADW